MISNAIALSWWSTGTADGVESADSPDQDTTSMNSIDAPSNRLRMWSLALVLAACSAGCAPDGAATDAPGTEPAESPPSSAAADQSVPESSELVESVADVHAEEPATPADPGRAFLAENAEREGVVTTASGLQYEVLASGDGATPGPTDSVTTHYHGTFVDGRVFDSSVRGGNPATFRVNGVIKGWTEALQMMKVGDKWKIVCPPDLAYGEQGWATIPPSSTLVFEIELLGVQPSG